MHDAMGSSALAWKNRMTVAAFGAGNHLINALRGVEPSQALPDHDIAARQASLSRIRPSLQRDFEYVGARWRALNPGSYYVQHHSAILNARLR